MKTRRLLLIACAGVGLVVILALAGSAYWEHQRKPFQNAPELISALHAFSHDRRANGRELPAEISLHDLLQEGYLTANDVRAFEGMEVTFNMQVDDTHPQMFLARARTQDGQFICLLADGSVQQFSASRYSEALRNSGQQRGSENGSQSIRSETNSTTRTAVSPR